MGIISILTVFSLATSALALAPTSPLPGYGVEPISWQVKTPSGGPSFNLTGTVEEVVLQLFDLDPAYEKYFNDTVNAALFTPRQVQDDVDTLSKRDVFCGGLGNAQKLFIQNGITYLRTVGGSPTNGPGPNNCGRVSCSQNSAIWWCNDNTSPKTLPSFNTIADSAQLILNNCFRNGALLGGGQETHGDNWRGLVKGDQC